MKIMNINDYDLKSRQKSSRVVYKEDLLYILFWVK